MVYANVKKVKARIREHGRMSSGGPRMQLHHSGLLEREKPREAQSRYPATSGVVPNGQNMCSMPAYTPDCECPARGLPVLPGRFASRPNVPDLLFLTVAAWKPSSVRFDRL